MFKLFFNEPLGSAASGPGEDVAFPTGSRPASRQRLPADGQRSVASPGWTDRVPLPPDQVFFTTRYGVYAAPPRRPCPSHRRDRPLPRPHATSGWPPRPPGMLPQALPRGAATARRHTTALTGLPLQSNAHAADSLASGGGAPPRGITPVHTRNWPHRGHRSGCRSPRSAHTVCQSSGSGPSTGGCPSAARHPARAAACVGWYNP
jgi:hypothetical protein